MTISWLHNKNDSVNAAIHVSIILCINETDCVLSFVNTKQITRRKGMPNHKLNILRLYMKQKPAFVIVTNI